MQLQCYRHGLTVLFALLLSAGAPAFGDCAANPSQPGTDRLYSSAWGIAADNQRFQHASNTRINADNAASLTLKWAYGLSTDKPRSFPLVTEDTIFIGDGGHGLVALARDSGCVRWENTAVDDIGTAIVPAEVHGQVALVFAQRGSGIYAADARNGNILWHNALEQLPLAMFSGTPLYHNGKVFVPLSSEEIARSLNPLFDCCKTSGGLVALDAADGTMLWHRPTIDEPAKLTEDNLLLGDQYGPSGAPVWSSPTLDKKRNLLYFGTGQNYSHPATLTSDAIFAVHADSGKVAWVRQFTANDTYNMSCEVSERHPNCPVPTGPDLDFGAPPVLVEYAGSELLYAGQKSGDVYAIDPATGETVWSRKLGRGGKLGGVHWGMSASTQTGLLYVPISDISRGKPDEQGAPGLFALDLRDGSIHWQRQREPLCEERNCFPGLSSAITSAPGIVVTGGLDGVLEVVDAVDGKLLWSFATDVEFTAVNGIDTSGGGFDAHGPMLADDLLIVSSGYGSFMQKGGNALLVFEISGSK